MDSPGRTLIPQLLGFLKALQPAHGVPGSAVRDVFRAIAASVIRQDPTQLISHLATSIHWSPRPFTQESSLWFLSSRAFLKERYMFPVLFMTLTTKAARVKTVGSFIAEDPGNQDRRTSFTIDSFVKV
jgi:hypothetical protein